MAHRLNVLVPGTVLLSLALGGPAAHAQAGEAFLEQYRTKE
jgi:hypothetical protein